jgi:hypothetical protein
MINPNKYGYRASRPAIPTQDADGQISHQIETSLSSGITSRGIIYQAPNK